MICGSALGVGQLHRCGRRCPSPGHHCWPWRPVRSGGPFARRPFAATAAGPAGPRRWPLATHADGVDDGRRRRGCRKGEGFLLGDGLANPHAVDTVLDAELLGMPVGRVAEVVVRGLDRQHAGLDQGGHLFRDLGGNARRQIAVLGLDDYDAAADRLGLAGQRGPSTPSAA